MLLKILEIFSCLSPKVCPGKNGIGIYFENNSGKTGKNKNTCNACK